MRLHHRQQDGDRCLFYSAHALTGDTTLLALADRVSSATGTAVFYAALPVAGYVAVTRYAHPEPAGLDFWNAERELMLSLSQPAAGYLVSISGVSDDMLHAVAVLIEAEQVQVSDPNFSDIEVLTWPQFLDSRWSQAGRIDMLMPAGIY